MSKFEMEFPNDAKVDLDKLAEQVEEKSGARAELVVAQEPYTITKIAEDGTEVVEYHGYKIEAQGAGLDESRIAEIVAEHKPEEDEREKADLARRSDRLAQLRADVLEALPELLSLLKKR